jgi:hypothetical protein
MQPYPEVKMTEQMTCPKCGGIMEEGYSPDFYHNGLANQSFWSRGKTRTSFWGGIKTDQNNVYPITYYRCTRCGYLESYAPVNDK